VAPYHINERVKAQSGYFILHPLSKNTKIKPFDTLLKENKLQNNLDKIIIPRNKKRKIKMELDKLNINKFTIYADLDGLANKIRTDLTTLPLFVKETAYIKKNNITGNRHTFSNSVL